MGAIITDEETCRLARELAQLTGETVTDAIAIAFQDRLQKKIEVQQRLQRILAVSERSSMLFRESGAPPDHGEFLYDELGLPT